MRRSLCVMTAANNEIEFEKVNYYLQVELSSLGIDCKKSEFNDRHELEAFVTTIKRVYFQDYKTAYNTSSIEIDQSHFDHRI